ncbi:MAG TPA: histidine kinase [Pyrinomonadaceae bacterium]|nr:histidine kinase [Pyrinomonadaceae bacterium]
MRSLVQKYWKAACVVVGCWTFLALLFTPQTYLSNLRAPTPLTWSQALGATLALFYVWAALTPFVLWLGGRFAFERPRLLRNLLVHLVLCVPVSLAHILLLQNVNAIVLAWSHTYRPPVPLVALFVGLGATNVMVYWGIIAVSQAVNYFRKYQEREFRLAQAQLQALRMQLHPHFLFNTLNAIAELVYSDPKTADRSIVSLSELLRFSLESEKSQEVTLKKEIDFLEKHVEIQQTLMRDRLRVKMNIDPETLDARVPNMLLQPLVENAIKHGISPRPEGGNIEVYARRLDGKLYVEITDDGLGMPEQEDGNGLGLVNTRERLRHLYGEAQDFNLSSFPGRGVTIRISLPFKEAFKEAFREARTDDTNAAY